MSEVTYADLIEQYAKLEKYASYPEDGEWVMIVSRQWYYRTRRRIALARRSGARVRVLKHRGRRLKILWK